MNISDIVAIGHKGGASDIHIKVGLPPMFRISGSLVALKGAERLNTEQVVQMAQSMLNDRLRRELETNRQVDLAHSIAGLGRFRVNIYYQRGTVSMAIRVIPHNVPSFEDLNLPPVLKKISDFRRGMVLVTGTTSSGKSSTLAAMINYINASRTEHIITIEDPIEYLIRDNRCMVNQRELGVDTLTYAGALKAALRQDPDVILLGELRDLETVDVAMAAAETGHMVFSTLHTMDATETITRIVSLFPPHQQKSVRLQLTNVLKAVISQRLMPRADGKGRVPACEVMIVTNRLRELIADETKLKEIPDSIAQGFQSYGMMTFDQSLMTLVRQNFITYAEAMKQATNPADFELRFQGISSTSDAKWSDAEAGSPDVQQAEEDDFTIERF